MSLKIQIPSDLFMTLQKSPKPTKTGVFKRYSCQSIEPTMYNNDFFSPAITTDGIAVVLFGTCIPVVARTMESQFRF
jgi:hypothetical protein